MGIDEEIASAREIWDEVVKNDCLLSILSWDISQLTIVGFAVRSLLRWFAACYLAVCETEVAVQSRETKQTQPLDWELLPIFRPVPKTEELGSSARSDSTVTAH